MNTLADLFTARVAELGDAPALHVKVGDEWQTTTWAEYGAEARALTLALNERGVKRGSSVALISDAKPAFFAVEMATVSLGAKSASIYQTNSAEQVLYVIQNSEANIIFAEDDAQVAKINSIRDQVEGDLLVVAFNGETGDISYPDLLAQGEALDAANPEKFAEISHAGQIDDPACIIYTSGTTGLPKAALISHRSILTTLDAVEDEWAIPGVPFRVVSYLPLAHIAERVMSFYSQLKSGGEVFFSTVPTIKEDLAVAKPTRFLAVPRVWEKFEEALAAKIPDPSVLSTEQRAGVLAMLGMDQIRIAVSGAAPISVDTINYFGGLGIEILEVYGMTETTGLTVANPVGAAKVGTVGKPVKGVEVQIADDGEILIRGANFSGYLKNPEATAEALEGGWMHSGDLGSMDEYGYITITGRKKDLIITAGGENIAPNNIQLLLARSPYISQAVVIGDKRRFISALITLTEETIMPWAAENGLEGASYEEVTKSPQVLALVDAAVEEANTHLARVSQVRKFVILPRDLSLEDGELTPTMKIKRNIVEINHEAAIESIYAN